MREYLCQHETLFTEDYDNAAISIVWYRNDKVRTIVFAFIELLPKEFPEPIEIEEKSISLNKKGAQRQAFYYKKIKCSVKDALEWYASIQNGQDIAFVNGEDMHFFKYDYKEDVQFPNLLVSNKLPYVYGYDNCVRYNTQYNIEMPLNIKTLIYETRYRNFINDNINFDIVKHPQYIGSINIAAYNPLIRDVRIRLQSDENTFQEKVLVKIEPRENANLTGLKYVHIEKRLNGYANYKEIEITDTTFTISAQNNVEQVAYLIICPKRGIIDCANFCNFVKSIQCSFDIVAGRKNVNVPDKNLKNQMASNYQTDMISDTSEIVVKDDFKPSEELRSFLLNCEELKKLQKEEENNTQRIFYNNPEEAEEFVRNIIASARKTVVIIDPYFNVRELFNFAFAVKNPKIPIEIITSFIGFKNCENSEKAVQLAQNLLNNIEKYKSYNNICSYIMLGDKPAFHDRFIIVDDNVWLSGNSLADIGKRASILVKLQNPKEILNIHEQIVQDEKKCLPLREWLNGKKTS